LIAIWSITDLRFIVFIILKVDFLSTCCITLGKGKTTMTIENENSLKKLVGMLIEVLHGEYSDTRDLAVIQLSILGEKAVPYISAYLKDEAEKEADMIKYFELYKDWQIKDQKYYQAKRNFEGIFFREWDTEKAKEKMRYEELLQKTLNEFATSRKVWKDYANVLINKYNISDPYFFDDSNDATPEYIASKIEFAVGGESRRHAIEGALKALEIMGAKKAIPLLQSCPVYQFPYREYCDAPLTPVFEKVNETIKIIQNATS
jgi:hypothetical protein